MGTRRTSILIDDKLFVKLRQLQANLTLSENSTVSLSSIINKMILEKMDSATSDTSKIVGLAIENTLLEISKSIADQVGRRLYEKHQTYFADYLQNPQQLHGILKETFGNSYKSVIAKIEQNIKHHVKDAKN